MRLPLFHLLRCDAGRAVRALAAVLALAVIAAGLATSAAFAQDEPTGTSYITPFPAGDVYATVVIGDDLADSLLYGLNEAFQGDARLQIRPKPIQVNGLMRADFAMKLQELDEELKANPVHIAIVMLGAWDRVSVRDSSGKRQPVRSDGWKAEYAARADRLMKTLKRRNVAVYWVGLPNLRRWDANEDAQMMNNVVRERTYLNGLKYIDAFAGFADESGGYSAHGPDITGKITLLRQGDGLWFTAAGNRKLAHFVERDLRRDLTQAKADRSIPLAGSDAEQAKINPDKAQLAPADGAPADGTQPAGAAAAPKQTPAASAAASDASGDQKADNGRISLRMINQTGREEVVTLDIVRPAIPASVVALVTRRERPDKASQMGEPIVDQLPGGLTQMSTVALATSRGPSGGRRALSPAQTPYFRVLFKGERLPPKPGRADDLTWPRPDPPADTAALGGDPVETGTTVAPPEEPAERQRTRRRTRD